MLRETQATTMEIVVVAEAGRWVPEDTVRQLCSLNLDWDSLHTLQGLLRYNSLGRILRYLTKQRTLVHSRLRRRKIPYAITVYRDYLDGEDVISWENFKKINDNLDEPYTHPRNLAAGSVRKLNPEKFARTFHKKSSRQTGI